MLGKARFPLSLRSVALILLGGLVLATHMGRWLLPTRSPAAEVSIDGDWIGSEAAGARLYLRYTVDVPFAADHAWLAIATDSHELIVNGRRVHSNQAARNPSLPYQRHTSDPLQGLNANVPEMVRSPDLRHAPGREWRTVRYLDITRAVREGRNVFALYLQSAERPRFALVGRISGGSQSVEIRSDASDWRVSPTAARLSGQSWSEPRAPDRDWAPAQSLGPVTERLLATAPPEIWTRPMAPAAIQGPIELGEMRIGLPLPGVNFGEPSRSNWIRIRSDWPYSIFSGRALVGNGSGDGIANVFDVTRFRPLGESRISLRFARPPGAAAPLPNAMIDGQIGALALTSDTLWSALQSDHPDWLNGGGEWETANIIPSTTMPRRTLLAAASPGYSVWMTQFAALWAACALALGLVLAALQAVMVRLQPSSAAAGRTAAALVTVPLVAIGLVEFLHFRFAETETVLDFVDPANQAARFLVGPVVAILTAVVLALPRLPAAAGARTPSALPAPLPLLRDARVWLILVGIVGFWLRWYGIPVDDLQADENVSWDAARGILETGVPDAVSGVLYTRSPLYHYALAAWLWLFGDTLTSARAFSVLPGVAVIFATYVLALRVSGRTAIALLVATLIALDPWQIFTSTAIRFYQQTQFFCVLSIYYFLKGFVWKDGKSSQNKFFIFIFLAVMSQEVLVVLFPGLCIAGYLFYKPWIWKENINVCVGFALVLGLTIFDMAIFSILCLTPHVGVATTSASIMQLHVINPHIYFTSFFIGNGGTHLFYTVLFFLGIPIWARQKNKAMISIYVVIAATLVTVTVLIMQVAHRYTFPIYPLFVLAAVASADAVIRASAAWVGACASPGGGLRERRWMQLVWPVLGMGMLVNLDLPRVARSYGTMINLQHQTAYEYIATFGRSGDKVLTVSPMAGAIVLKHVDYYLMNQIYFDEIYWDGDAIVDRWSGGQLVTKVDMVRDIFLRNERVWVMLDDHETRRMPADLIGFVNASTEVRKEFFGVRLLLWEAGNGRMALARDDGGSTDTY